MQTILGAGGPIADELARELYRHHTQDLRLVSRHPRAVHDTDELVSADLTDPEAALRAVTGSETVYLTVGLPPDSALWEQKFPVIMRNVIAACESTGARLVFFDNTYMYPGTPEPQTEQTAFAPGGRKGRVRAQIATVLLEAMDLGRVEAVVCRAPEFYGPQGTKSWTNSLVFDRIRSRKRPFVPASASTVRSLIWTPDASRAMALIGNTADAYGRTWHLPVAPDRMTYRQIIATASELTGRRIGFTVLPLWVLRLAGRINPQVGEMVELLPRYRGDNVFDCTDFVARFPDFPITSYRDGIETILITEGASA